MRQLLVLGVIILMLGISSRAGAGIILQIQVFENTPPAQAGQKAPDKGKMTLSVEVLAEPGAPFHSRTRLGDRTIEIKGTLRAMKDGTYQADCSFSDITTNPNGMGLTKAWKTNLLAPLGEDVIANGAPDSQTYLQIKPDPARQAPQRD
jgi:hypothetical protein